MQSTFSPERKPDLCYCTKENTQYLTSSERTPRNYAQFSTSPDQKELPCSFLMHLKEHQVSLTAPVLVWHQGSAVWHLPGLIKVKQHFPVESWARAGSWGSLATGSSGGWSIFGRTARPQSAWQDVRCDEVSGLGSRGSRFIYSLLRCLRGPSRNEHANKS